jgi:hypothetical protein
MSHVTKKDYVYGVFTENDYVKDTLESVWTTRDLAIEAMESLQDRYPEEADRIYWKTLRLDKE